MKEGKSYILGISNFMHDYSSCLLEDGYIKTAIEDERITRVKHGIDEKKYTDAYRKGALIQALASDRLVTGRHNHSMKYCLDYAGITVDDIDLIVATLPVTDDSLNNDPNTVFITHHNAHAASAFFPSEFDQSAILTLDGIGSNITAREYETTTLGYGEGNTIRTIKRIVGQSRDVRFVTNSLGIFYEVVTILSGFGYMHAGKTMGLAPYGRPIYVEDMRQFIKLKDNGSFEAYPEKLYAWGIELIKNFPADPAERFIHEADIACAGQEILQEVILHIALALYKETKTPNLCIAGGVGLNSVANEKILRLTPFENIFIQPAAGDNGLSIGAALYGYYQLNRNPRHPSNRYVMNHAYLGRQYNDTEITRAIESLVDKNKINVIKSPSVVKDTVDNIINQKIVGFFQGGSEFGPRALGHRSIIVDPRSPGMKDYLNARVKFRESFRPFAPMVLLEHLSEYFEMEHPAPFMLIVPRIKEEKRNVIPAVTHVDGTGRVQTITKQDNGIVFDLIDEFYNRTGVPILLNTSFNVKGEPIVESPVDAIKCFLGTKIDVLVIHDYLLIKKDND